MFCVIRNFCVIPVSRCKQWRDITSRILFALFLTFRSVQSLSSGKCWGLCLGPDEKALAVYMWQELVRLEQQLMLLGILPSFARIGSGKVGHALGCRVGRRKNK